MNFTREPIIETVITPREGHKLIVRSSKSANQEDYFVDAVEVVSFGHSFFYRCLERPQSFLVPVGDYEVFELKDTRVALKNATPERSIKIGGGRDAPMRRESEEVPSGASSSDRGRREGRRRRGRRGRDRSEQQSSPMPQEAQERDLLPQEEDVPFETSERVPERTPEPFQTERFPEEPKAPSFISKLFPPPPTLIKDSISRYKTAETPTEDLFPPASEEPVAFEESNFEHSEKPKEGDVSEMEEE